MKVMSCVLILRTIAATDVPARETKAQVYPFVARLQALLTALRPRLNITDLREMRARISHDDSLHSSKSELTFRLIPQANEKQSCTLEQLRWL